MPHLSGIDGRTLSNVPDVTGSISSLVDTFKQFGQLKSQQLQQQKIQQQIDIISREGAPKTEKEAALLRLGAISPQVAAATRAVLDRGDRQELLAAQQAIEKGVREATIIKRAGGHKERLVALKNIAAQKQSAGQDISRIVELSNLSPSQLELELDKMLVQGADMKALVATGLAEPEERFEAVLDAQGRVVGQKSSKTGQVVSDPRTRLDPFRASKLPTRQRIEGEETIFEELDPSTGRFVELSRGPRFQPREAKADGGISKISSEKFTLKSLDKFKKTGNFADLKFRPETKEAGDKIATGETEILADGSTIQAFKNGEVIVKNRLGQTVEGDARLKVLDAANKFQLDLARTTAGQKAAGSQAIAQSTKAFEKIADIRTSMLTIDRGIDALDRGAKTGALTSFFPSIRAASVELDNIQAQMGLNVIQNTTFGSLSTEELKFALSAALPLKLDEPELRDWLVRKKSAQLKLSNYLQNTAIFLGTPGNTVAKWMQTQRDIQKGREGSGGGLTPTQRKRLEELRKKQGAR